MNFTANIHRAKRIWSFVRKYVFWFALAEICILVSYGVSICLPINLKQLVDEVLYGNRFDLLPTTITNYVILFLSATVFNFLYAFVWQYLNNHYVLDVKNKLFEKLLFSKSKFLSSMNSGDMMTRIDGDAEQFIHIIQRNIFHFINSILMCMGIVLLVAKLNFFISLMLVIAAVLPIVITRLFGKYTENFSKESREVFGQTTGTIYEVFKGLREIKLFNAEGIISKKLFSAFKYLIILGNKVRYVDFFVNKLIYLVNLLVSVLIYAYSAYLIFNNELSIGVFLAIIEYIALLHKKFNWILRIYLDWFNRKISIDRVIEILDLETEIQDGRKIENINKIEFRNVAFSYNENLVLNNLNLTINKGERIGIVGRSGKGKTTVISLLLGLFEANKGEVLINDIPLSEIDLSTVRQHIAVVSQDIILFDDTIRYNLTLGNDYPDEEIIEVLKSVELYDIIEKLPNGIDTKIGMSTNNLSGGQKQRIMLARALLKRVSLIILDEATSALDIETEKNVVEYLLKSSKGTTMLIISHRVESIINCNKIMVLDNCKIVDVGDHYELINRSPDYSSLFGS